MEFGIFNLMGAREPEKTAAQVFAEVAEQTRLADELGYAIAWFAEHHFSNYCLCASPLMMVAHCASITKKIRLGTAVVVLPLYNPARLAAEAVRREVAHEGVALAPLAIAAHPVVRSPGGARRLVDHRSRVEEGAVHAPCLRGERSDVRFLVRLRDARAAESEDEALA